MATTTRLGSRESHDPALADALLDLDAAHARVDELSDRVAELESENQQLRRQLTTASTAATR